MGGELDDLARVQAKLLVIVEHGVHILNPDGIDWAIEHDPVLVLRLVSAASLHNNGQHTIIPLLSRWVNVSVH
jgi:hypothetical protein